MTAIEKNADGLQVAYGKAQAPAIVKTVGKTVHLLKVEVNASLPKVQFDMPFENALMTRGWIVVREPITGTGTISLNIKDGTAEAVVLATATSATTGVSAAAGAGLAKANKGNVEVVLPDTITAGVVDFIIEYIN